jgi:hypothetical protein
MDLCDLNINTYQGRRVHDGTQKLGVNHSYANVFRACAVRLVDVMTTIRQIVQSVRGGGLSQRDVPRIPCSRCGEHMSVDLDDFVQRSRSPVCHECDRRLRNRKRVKIYT